MSVPAQAGDPRFFARTGPHSLYEVARAAGVMAPAGHAGTLLSGVAPLAAAGPDHVSFMTDKRHLDALTATQAGVVLVSASLARHVPPGTVPLVVPDPHLAWARVASLFYPVPPISPGLHPSAVVDPAARIDPTAEIGPLAVIEAGAEIGPRTRVGAQAFIGAGVVLGADVRIGTQASVSHALIGDRVVLYPGARVGQDGFGFAMTPSGFVSVPQIGRVIIEDDVEIGANTTIDRGSANDTVIGMGSRLDNLVQIGHNVRIGRFCVIVAQVGISGSTVLEDFVVVAGQAGLVGHLRIGAKARIGPQAGVSHDVPAGAEVVGSPAQPFKEFARDRIRLARLLRQAGAVKSTGDA